jgi:hypothetical protein
MMIVYIVISTACVLFCIIATMRVWFDHIRQKRESRAEIEHLKAEVRACRELLRAKK